MDYPLLCHQSVGLLHFFTVPELSILPLVLPSSLTLNLTQALKPIHPFFIHHAYVSWQSINPVSQVCICSQPAWKQLN